MFVAVEQFVARQHRKLAFEVAKETQLKVRSFDFTT